MNSFLFDSCVNKSKLCPSQHSNRNLHCSPPSNGGFAGVWPIFCLSTPMTPASQELMLMITDELRCTASSPELRRDFGTAIVNSIPNKRSSRKTRRPLICVLYVRDFTLAYPYRSRAGSPVGHPTRCRVGVGRGSGDFRPPRLFWSA